MKDFDRTIVTVVAVVLAAMCCTGCMFPGRRGQPVPVEEEIAMEPISTEAMLASAESSRFEDIPVPATLVYDRQKSFAFENDNVRVAYLVYEGKGDIAEVVQFMLDKLTGDGWQLGNVIERGETTLVFTESSRKEQLTVSIVQNGRNVILAITLTPGGPSRMASPSAR